MDRRLERAPDSSGADWDKGLAVHLPPRSARQLNYELAAKARGDLSLGAMYATCFSPWGLAQSRKMYAGEHSVRVQPGVRDLLRTGGRRIRERREQPGLRPTRIFGDGRDFESLRDYVKGDDPRIVDWKASARGGRLLVRNYEAETSQSVVLAIDCGRHMREAMLGRERVDFALGASLLLSARARRFQDRIGVIVFDRKVRQVLPSRRASPARISAAFSQVETRLAESNYAMAFAQLRRSFPRRSLIILFCDVVDPGVSGALMGELAALAPHHLPLAIAIRNPALEDAARASVSSREAAFHRAAAEELVAARELALSLMRRSGIRIVDTPPGDALVRTVDRYVEIKERGLL